MKKRKKVGSNKTSLQAVKNTIPLESQPLTSKFSTSIHKTPIHIYTQNMQGILGGDGHVDCNHSGHGDGHRGDHGGGGSDANSPLGDGLNWGYGVSGNRTLGGGAASPWINNTWSLNFLGDKHQLPKYTKYLLTYSREASRIYEEEHLKNFNTFYEVTNIKHEDVIIKMLVQIFTK